MSTIESLIAVSLLKVPSDIALYIAQFINSRITISDMTNMSVEIKKCVALYKRIKTSEFEVTSIHIDTIRSNPIVESIISLLWNGNVFKCACKYVTEYERVQYVLKDQLISCQDPDYFQYKCEYCLYCCGTSDDKKFHDYCIDYCYKRGGSWIDSPVVDPVLGTSNSLILFVSKRGIPKHWIKRHVLKQNASWDISLTINDEMVKLISHDGQSHNRKSVVIQSDVCVVYE